MSADWKTGDKAVRVEKPSTPLDESQFSAPNGLASVIGRIYLVAGVVEHRGGTGLLIQGHPLIAASDGMDWGYPERKFRKIVPACDRAEIAQHNEATS